jgi:hypothetical protein
MLSVDFWLPKTVPTHFRCKNPHRKRWDEALGQTLQPTFFSPFFAFLAKTHPKPPFGIHLAFQPPPPKNIVFLVIILFCIDSALSSLAAMSAPLPLPSASTGDRRRRLPLSTSLLPPPLPPQLPPLSACRCYHRHRCRRFSVSAATARCCRRCCSCCCRCCCRRHHHHLRCRFSF